jgi:DNA invertase Pin-like site-specific DNA recombinase
LRFWQYLHEVLAAEKPEERDRFFYGMLLRLASSKASHSILVLHMLGAVAQFERDLIIERTRAGLAAARKRGKRLGLQSSGKKTWRGKLRL